MILLGQHHLSINHQGLLALPSGICVGLQNHAYLVQGFDRNLLLMTAQSFERYYSLVKNTSLSDPLARLLTRLFLGSAVEVNIDDSGEIQLPADLRDYAGLDENVVVVGQGDYFEVWSPTAWEEQTANMHDHQANVDRFSKFNLATA